MQKISRSGEGFAQSKLPWLLAIGAVLLYVITLCPWISFRGFATLAKASGWDWRPTYIAPLQFLVTLPVRWFPVHWQPAVTNLVAVICSSLTLGLLARSVSILPHDRTREQRHHEHSEHSFLTNYAAWVPPVLAVLVCGLQMSFWENAIVATGEALDLLLFAYVLRCLLEFRVEQRESWLTRAAFVYGLAVTNNFSMIPFLPVFVGAIIWIRGREFFNLRFCRRMLLFGLLGLSLYLLLPMIGILSGSTDQSFFEFLKVNLGFQKNTMLGVPRYIVFLLSLVSVFPVIFIGIKWPASFGDINAAGTALTNLMSHVIHAVFLLACFYVAFDPPFSPRRLGGGMPFLPLVYLGALSVGYFSGYFLLVFNPKGAGPFGRRSALRQMINYAVSGLVWIAAVAVPVGLIARNLPPIRASHGPQFSQFGKLAVQSLPAEGAIILSDDNLRLFSVETALARAGTLDKYVLVDTSALRLPAYHATMARRYPALWPTRFTQYPQEIDPLPLMQLIGELVQKKPVYYLHPSFGYYFENFYLVPNNVVYRMLPFSTNTPAPPLLTAEQVQQNEAFWQELKGGDFKELAREVKLAKAKKQENVSAVLMGAIYSRAINYFAVELQKRGDLAKARDYFELALDVNPDNVAALINLDYNKLRAVGGTEARPSEAVAKKMGVYRGSWEAVLGYNGPVDEPNSCYLLAQSFTKGHNYRQAAQLLERIEAFTPDNVSAQIALASVYVQGGRQEDALRKVTNIRTKFPKMTEDQSLTLFECEAWAQSFKGDLPAAQKILSTAERAYPNRSEPFKGMAEIYLSQGDLTNAMASLKDLIQAQPDNLDGLINYAALNIRIGRFKEAIPSLDRALLLQPENLYALLNRAIANLQLENFDAARQDYEALELHLPKPMHAIHYALGEIAIRQKHPEKARKHFEKYLKLAPPGTPEMKFVEHRMQQLKSGAI